MCDLVVTIGKSMSTVVIVVLDRVMLMVGEVRELEVLGG